MALQAIQLTSVVDEDVEVAWALLDLSDGLLDRCIVVYINADRLDRVLRLGKFADDALDGIGRLFSRASGAEHVVRLLSLEKDLASLITDTAVASGDEDDRRRAHGAHCAEFIGE
jgi:hypothetical protein